MPFLGAWRGGLICISKIALKIMIFLRFVFGSHKHTPRTNTLARPTLRSFGRLGVAVYCWCAVRLLPHWPPLASVAGSRRHRS